MILLEFDRHPLRLLALDRQIWCVIDDLALVLVLGEPVAALANQLEADEQIKLPIEREEREVLCANEWGIYGLMRGSNNPVAHRFKHWWQTTAIPKVRQSPPNATITPGEALNLVVPIFRDLGVDAERLGIWLLAQYRRIYPNLSDIFIDIRQSEPQLGSSIPTNPSPVKLAECPVVSSQRFIPKEIGQIIAKRYELSFIPSAQKVNKALVRLNFQILAPVLNDDQDEQFTHNDGKEWKLTRTGHRYGRLENRVNEHGKNRVQLRWSVEVVPLVAQELGYI